MSRVLFIGLGNMGLPMAKNLVKAGHHVFGFDLSELAMENFSKAGGFRSISLNTEIKDVDFVITMLPSGKLVSDVLLEKNALFKEAREGTTFIDSSTIDVDTAKRLAQTALERGHFMLDAPVSGGTGGAALGTLTFMVGGNIATLERARPLLEAMGKNLFHAGEAGTGQIAKVCNNMLLAIHMIGTSEALNLGKALGMDPKVLSEIMSKSSGSNWSLNTYNPYPGVMENVPASRDYAGGFTVDLMNKDLGLAAESALRSKTPIPLGHGAMDLYRVHAQMGSKHLDFSSIIQFLRPLD
ncbi:MAG: 3-hydroxyisobutyrate dehydrogenase [Chitinophagaceae bacterium]|nr:3-hydroxyisobutyrate dehydrogenase [Oligoflexus sp.]